MSLTQCAAALLSHNAVDPKCDHATGVLSKSAPPAIYGPHMNITLFLTTSSSPVRCLTSPQPYRNPKPALCATPNHNLNPNHGGGTPTTGITLRHRTGVRASGHKHPENRPGERITAEDMVQSRSRVCSLNFCSFFWLSLQG